MASILLYLLAALAEIAGCFSFWSWRRLGQSPLWLLPGMASLAAFVASRFATVVLYGQSSGVYDHYFNTFLIPSDILWSFVQAICMAIAVMLIHTYYGYNADGGPVGVGVAGRPCRRQGASPGGRWRLESCLDV